MKIRRRARRGEADISTIPIIPLSLAVFAVALVMVLMGQTPPQLFGWALLLLPLPWLPLGAWIAARTRLPFTAFLLLSTFIGFAFSPLLMALVRLISPAALPLFIASLLCNLASALLLKRPSAPKPRLPRKIAFSSTAALFIILFAFYITLPLWGAGQDNPRADLLKPITERNPDRTFTKLFTMDYLGRVSYISELARGGLPPRVPYLAAERFPFHWFWFLIAADLSTLAGASAFFMNKLLPVACIVLFLATLYHAARYFEKKYLFTAAVLLFATVLASYEHFGLLLQDLSRNISWISFLLAPGNAEEGLTDCYNSLVHNYIFSNHGLIALAFLVWSLISLAAASRAIKVVMGVILGLGVMYQPFLCLGALALLGALLLLELTPRLRRGWLYAALIASAAPLCDLRLVPIPLLMLLFGFFRPSLRRSKEIVWILLPAGLTAVLALKVLIGPVPVHGESVISLNPGLLLIEEGRYDLAATVLSGRWGILIAFNILLSLYLLPVVLCSRLRCEAAGRLVSLLVAGMAFALLNAAPVLSLGGNALRVPGLETVSHNFLAVFVSLLEMGVPVVFIPWMALGQERKTSLLFEAALAGSIVFYFLMNAVSIHNIHGDFLFKFSILHRLMLCFLGAYGFVCFVSAVRSGGRALKAVGLTWAAAAFLLALPFTVQFVRWNLDTSTEPLLHVTEAEAELISWVRNNTSPDAVIQGIPLKPRKHLGLIVPFMDRRTGYIHLEEISFLKGAEIGERYRKLFGDASEARTPDRFRQSFRSLGVDYICVFDHADETVKGRLRAFAENDGSIQEVYSGKAGEVFLLRPES